MIRAPTAAPRGFKILRADVVVPSPLVGEGIERRSTASDGRGGSPSPILDVERLRLPSPTRGEGTMTAIVLEDVLPGTSSELF
jgi:hypothetical protein